MIIKKEKYNNIIIRKMQTSSAGSSTTTISKDETKISSQDNIIINEEKLTITTTTNTINNKSSLESLLEQLNPANFLSFGGEGVEIIEEKTKEKTQETTNENNKEKKSIPSLPLKDEIKSNYVNFNKKEEELEKSKNKYKELEEIRKTKEQDIKKKQEEITESSEKKEERYYEIIKEQTETIKKTEEWKKKFDGLSIDDVKKAVGYGIGMAALGYALWKFKDTILSGLGGLFKSGGNSTSTNNIVINLGVDGVKEGGRQISEGIKTKLNQELPQVTVKTINSLGDFVLANPTIVVVSVMALGMTIGTIKGIKILQQILKVVSKV